MSKSVDDEHISNPKGRMSSDSAVLKTRNRPLKIGTWNVRTLYQAGKLDNAIYEMNKMKLDILGIADNGKIRRDTHTVIYSGGQEHKYGVGIMMKNGIAKAMIGYWAISNRVLMMKLQGKPFNISLIQAYAPTQDYSDEDIEQFYEEIQQAIKYTNSNNVLLVMGDFNAKVGMEAMEDVVGKFGIGNRNERGDRLIEFCQINNLTISNTWFQHHPRKVYTWKSPGDIVRNQIDYIMIKKRFRNNVKQAKAYPGADINSDHNPVVIKLKVKLKKMQKTQGRAHLNLDLLRESNYKSRYNIEIRNQYDILEQEECEQSPTDENEYIEMEWVKIKNTIKNAMKITLPNKENTKRKKWMTNAILQKMGQRRRYKNNDKERYNEINKEIKDDCRKAKENYINSQCNEIDKMGKQFRLREMHNKIKLVTSRIKRKNECRCIEDKSGKILFDSMQIVERWKEYIEDLYEDERDLAPYFATSTGEKILKEEVEHVIKMMKNGKATGSDEIPIEALKAFDEHNLEVVTELCNTIYNSGYIPTDMK